MKAMITIHLFIKATTVVLPIFACTHTGPPPTHIHAPMHTHVCVLMHTVYILKT